MPIDTTEQIAELAAWIVIRADQLAQQAGRHDRRRPDNLRRIASALLRP